MLIKSNERKDMKKVLEGKLKKPVDLKAGEEFLVEKSDFTPSEGQHVVQTSRGFKNMNRELARRMAFRKGVVNKHGASKKKFKNHSAGTAVVGVKSNLSNHDRHTLKQAQRKLAKGMQS